MDICGATKIAFCQLAELCNVECYEKEVRLATEYAPVSTAFGMRIGADVQRLSRDLEQKNTENPMIFDGKRIFSHITYEGRHINCTLTHDFYGKVTECGLKYPVYTDGFAGSDLTEYAIIKAYMCSKKEGGGFYNTEKTRRAVWSACVASAHGDTARAAKAFFEMLEESKRKGCIRNEYIDAIKAAGAYLYIAKAKSKD